MEARPNLVDRAEQSVRSLTERLGVAPRPEYQDVELGGVRLQDGAPLKVRCVRPDAEEMSRQMGVLPGELPPTASNGDGADEEKSLLEWTPGLIERWVEVEVEGKWVPAFSFADPCPPERIPARELTTVDVANLALTIMRLGGYAGGPGAGDRFLGQRGGSGRSD